MNHIDAIDSLLGKNKIVWVGGGYHLSQPTMKPFLCGGIVFALDEDPFGNNNDSHILNIEDLCYKRPDWNRLTDDETYNLLPKNINDEILSPWSNNIIFPYYVSNYAWWLSHRIRCNVIGNNNEQGERLYIRQHARLIAQEGRMSLPMTVRYKSKLPTYAQLVKEHKSHKLVLTPPYSDGGAWVYPVNNDKEYFDAAADICRNFPNSYIEVTPFYSGVSMNLNICNLVEPNTGRCHVVVYPPSVQIIGEPTLSDSKLRYCGCDFQAATDPAILLDREKLFSLAVDIGKALFRKYGWKGMFGIDFIVRPDGSLVFLEINPRLQSSTHILDEEFRDEWNPMLLQISAFLSPSLDVHEDVNLMDRTVGSSMLFAYNNQGRDLLTLSSAAKHPGIAGLPKMGKPVAPGAILFRQKAKTRVLRPDFQSLDENIRRVVRDQIENSFAPFNQDITPT